jgi:hypothetical protein
LAAGGALVRTIECPILLIVQQTSKMHPLWVFAGMPSRVTKPGDVRPFRRPILNLPLAREELNRTTRKTNGFAAGLNASISADHCARPPALWNDGVSPAMLRVLRVAISPVWRMRALTPFPSTQQFLRFVPEEQIEWG